MPTWRDGGGVSHCRAWDLLLWEIKAADLQQPATSVCYKDDRRAFQGRWILEENQSLECQLAVGNHIVAPQYAGCLPRVEGESESRGSPLGDLCGSSEIGPQCINNFSQFCGLCLRVPLPLYFLFLDSNCSLSNPEPKTLPWSFSVFLFIVAFRPCGCSGVPLITSSWKRQPLSCVCKLFHSALCLGRCESSLDRAACPWGHWKLGSKPWYFVVWKQSWPRYGPKGEDGAKHWELQVKKARKKKQHARQVQVGVNKPLYWICGQVINDLS